MEWFNLYPTDNQPTENEIAEYIDNQLWNNLNDFLQKNYSVEPLYSYSCCSMQKGWNVKYKKSERAICTLYPMSGFFTALIVIGEKEKNETELTMPLLSEYTQELFSNSPSSMGGRWLMINVTNEKILDDVKKLVQIRRKIKNLSVK